MIASTVNQLCAKETVVVVTNFLLDATPHSRLQGETYNGDFTDAYLREGRRFEGFGLTIEWSVQGDPEDNQAEIIIRVDPVHAYEGLDTGV